MQPIPTHLRSNDRIVFLGDSITEQHLYTNYVETYLASRYPELRLTFYNAGWGGDRAPGGLQRLERDVLALHPTVVTICYGMNDGRYTATTAEIRDAYVTGMRDLVKHLKAAGIRVVLLTPGMVDEIARPSLRTVEYNQQVLRSFADEVLTLGAAEQLPVGDLHQLMNEVDRRAKADDAKFCMIPDGVHPDPAGHLVMAFGVLQALGVPPRREELPVRVRRSGDEYVVTVKLDRLPFFVEPAARKVLPYLPFQETFNNLQLRVSGLTKDWAHLCIGSSPIPAISRSDLAQGINVANLWQSSVLAHAARVHHFTAEKTQLFFKAWRPLALNNLNSDSYLPAAHRAGMKASAALDRVRDQLLKGSRLTCRLTFIESDQPQPPLANGFFITRWNVLGPFPKPYATDRLGGEAAFSNKLPEQSGDWRAIEVSVNNLSNCLNAAIGPQQNCFAYAMTVLDSPVKQTGELLLGSDDGIAAWLNGVALGGNLDVCRPLVPDEDRFPVTLRAGKNVLLLKVSQGGGQWGFCARLAGLKRVLSV